VLLSIDAAILAAVAGSTTRLSGSFGSAGSLSSSMGTAQPLLVTDLSRRNRHEHGSTAALVTMLWGLSVVRECRADDIYAHKRTLAVA